MESQFESFESIFSRLDSGKRIGNPALNRGSWCREPETNEWDARTANMYQVYAGCRSLGMSSEDSMAKANSEIK